MRTLLVFISLIIPLNSFGSPFTLDKSRCVVQSESQITLAIGAETMPSKIRVELVFKGAYVLLPRLQVTFLSHEPARATIAWNNIISTRKNIRQFRNEIFERISSEEAKPFAMTRISPVGQIAVYETAPLDLARSQDLVALFLSQNEITVHAYTEQGDDWAGNYPLNSSDSSFRELAAQCYGEKTSAYVRGKGQRVDIKIKDTSGPRIASTAIHWSEGYGLTEFTALTAQVPAELAGKPVFAANDTEDTINKKLASWIQALKLKAEKSQELATITADAKYTALNEQIALQYQQLITVYERFVVLTGNNSESAGVIESKLNQQKNLTQQLATVDAQIVAAQTALAPISQANTDANGALTPFVPVLKDIDAKTASFNKNIADIQMLQQHLQAVLAVHVQELTAKNLQAPVVEAPWSSEEIDKKNKEIADNVARIQILQALQGHVAAITGEVDAIVQKAQTHQEASVAYLQAFAQQAALKTEIANVKNWLYKSREVPNFTVAAVDFFNGLNVKAEQDIAAKLAELQKTDAQATRNYKWEFDYHSGLYNQVEATFVENVTKLQSEKSLIASILCHPDVLKDERNRKKPCLIIDNALNDKTVENFFANLPPEDIDGLLGDVPRPWTNEKSKVEVLFDRYQQEIANPSDRLQTLVDTWGHLRQVIWRWVAMQKKAKALDVCGDPNLAAQLLPNDTYTDGFYVKVIECERAQVQYHNTKLQELNAQAEALGANVTTTQATLEAANIDFSTASRSFVTGTIEKLKDVALKTQASQIFTKCLLPLEKAEECSAAVHEVASGELVAREHQSYLDLVKAMVGNINGRLNILAQENANAVAEIQKLSEQKQAYIVQNNIAELIARREIIAAQLAKATTELAALNSTKSTTTQTLSQVQGEISALKTEAQSLMTTISSVSSAIEQLLPEFTPFCQKIVPNTNGLHDLNQTLYKLVGVSGEPEKVIESSCDRPDLKTFIPNQKTLSITGSIPR